MQPHVIQYRYPVEHWRLPIEVCEYIIDALAYNEYGQRGEPDELAALRACAFTCRAWLPRSLINLYQTITLCGDERTRNAVKYLRERGDNLAINVRTVETHIVADSMEKQNNTSPCLLIPYLLAALPEVIRSIQTVSIRGYSDIPIIESASPGWDIFLKSYGSFRSVQTLKLSHIGFDTFSYFARFITCFRALRHLDLFFVTFPKLNNYPPRPAKLKQYKLHTLAIDEVMPRDFCHLARWLLQADAISSLRSLSYHHSDRRTPDLDICISDMMASTGALLKYLTLGSVNGYNLDCRSSTSLQTIRLRLLRANSAASILSTISSRDLTTVKLEHIHADGIADVDALATILVSNPFTSLPKLNRIHVQITPTEKWCDRLAGTLEKRKQIVVAELDGPFSKLRDVVGERLETDIFWGFEGNRVDRTHEQP